MGNGLFIRFIYPIYIYNNFIEYLRERYIYIKEIILHYITTLKKQ